MVRTYRPQSFSIVFSHPVQHGPANGLQGDVHIIRNAHLAIEIRLSMSRSENSK